MAQPAETSTSVRILELCRVSPPPGFIPPSTSLSLTFFDLEWLPLPPVELLFFYSYHHSYSHFLHTTLPNIKNSLSLALQHFYPLAGTLAWPPQSTKPQVLCSQDNLSVIVTVMESSNVNFNNLVGNHGTSVIESYSLVPQITSSTNITQEDHHERPVMALQVTLFPNTGICIGITILHAIADGRTISHFMTSWASLCKSGLLSELSLPFYHRTLINDPNQLETIYLNELAKLNISQGCFTNRNNMPKHIDTADKFLATFLLDRSELQVIENWVRGRFDEKYHTKSIHSMVAQVQLHLSKFVLMCAYVWFCMIKVLHDHSDEDIDGLEREHLLFAVDCRERLNPSLPTTYFGNCLMPCFVDVSRYELMRKDGIAIAAEAIGNAIHRMTSEGVLMGGNNLFTKMKNLFSKNCFLSIAGSPRLAFYETDFGWEKPKKVKMVSINSTGAICFNGCRDRGGGLEVDLALPKLQMDAFTSLFKDTVRDISCSI